MQLSRLRTIKPKTPQQQLILDAGELKAPDGRIEHREYIIGKLIGCGRIAKVYEATNSLTNQKFAVKIIPKSNVEEPQSKHKLVNEINLQKGLDHQNVLKLEHAFEDINNIYIILEYCPNKTLEATVKSRQLNEAEVQKLLLQLVDAIKYLHERKIIHRNIKLPNIFLTENMEVRLGGFRLAAKLGSSSERRFSVCGNVDFVAPEIVNKTGYSTHADIWSFGVTTYQLLFRRLPFKDTCENKTVSRIKLNKFTFPSDIPVSSTAKNFISKLLVLQPESRLSLWEIGQHLFMNPTKIPVKDSFAETWTNPSLMSTNSDLSKRSSEIILEKKSCRSLTTLISPHTTKNSISSRIADPSLWSLNATPKKESETIHDARKLRKAFTFSESSKFDSSPVSFKTDSSDVMIFPSEFDASDIQEKEPQREEGTDIGLYVVKWIDYSSKYGLGYVLSDDSLGVIFNDNTQVLEIPSSQNFQYFSEASCGRKTQNVVYSFKDYPNTLERKIKIYKYFSDYLRQNRSGVSTLKNIKPEKCKNTGNTWNVPVTRSHRESSRETCEGYVQTWMKTDSAIFFKLNTKFVQVVFKDEATLMVNPHAKTMVYVGSKGERKGLKINDPKLDRNDEMSRRIGYVQKKIKEVWRAVSSVEI